MLDKGNSFDKKLKVDSHYTKDEIDFIRKNYSDLTKLKTSLLRSFINKDVRIASEVAILKHEKELIEIKNTLEGQGKKVGSLNFSNSKDCIKVIQMSLGLKPDGKLGKKTFDAILKFQTTNEDYKNDNCDLIVGNNCNSGGGEADGIINGRTVRSLVKYLKMQKIESIQSETVKSTENEILKSESIKPETVKLAENEILKSETLQLEPVKLEPAKLETTQLEIIKTEILQPNIPLVPLKTIETKIDTEIETKTKPVVESVPAKSDSTLVITPTSKEKQTIKDLHMFLNTSEKESISQEDNYEVAINQDVISENPNFKELQKLPLLANILTLYEDSVIKNVEGQTLGRMFNNNERNVKDLLNTLKNTYQKILSEVISGKVDNIKNGYNDFFSIISTIEKVTSSVSNIENVKQVFYDDKIKYENDRKEKVLEAFREGFIDKGNSLGVKEILWSDLSSKGNDNVQDVFFVELGNLIQSEELKSYFESGSSINNKLLTPELLLKSKKLYDEQIDKLNSHKREIKNSIRENNPEMADGELADNLADERIKIGALESSKSYLRDSVLDYQFDKNSDDKLSPNGKKYKEITHGLLADENKAIYSEIGLTVAMSVVPMGVGFVAGKLALSAGKGLANITRLSNLANTTGKLGSLSRLSGTVGGTALKGTGFYEGYEFTHDVMFEENISGLDDPKEIAKSIAFFGILGGITKIGGILKNTKLTDKIPDGFIKNTGKILSEVGGGAFALVGVSQATEYLLENGKIDGFTWQEYIQACMMILLGKGLGKSFVKNENETINPKLGTQTGNNKSFSSSENIKNTKHETEKKAKEETEKKAKEETEKKAKEETEKKAKEETEKKAKEEAEKKAKEEAEKKAKEETEKKAKEEAEKKPKKLYQKIDLEDYKTNGVINKENLKKLQKRLHQLYHSDKVIGTDAFDIYEKISKDLSNISLLLKGKHISKDKRNSTNPDMDLRQMATDMEGYLKRKGYIK